MEQEKTDRNPDVLECLANLSNDEVFTPPRVANAMLDLLPQELFRNPKTTFLDPCSKSGVFLREIAKRLIVGLEPAFPDLQERLDHIFQKQLFGFAITELTALTSRRTVPAAPSTAPSPPTANTPSPTSTPPRATSASLLLSTIGKVIGAKSAELRRKRLRRIRKNMPTPSSTASTQRKSST